MFTLDESIRERRCPCCRKKTVVTMGYFLNEQPRDWDNFIGRDYAKALATDGTCPWCGKRTTIVARILLQRFEPMMAAVERSR
jgi:hypothetical protein